MWCINLAGLSIKNLIKKYGEVIAVNNVNLEIQDKELIVFLGPSGCGKTTMLRCIAGLEKPNSGDILIGNESVVNIPPQKRDVAMVFQNYALYPHMKVYDNIAMPLKVRKYSTQEIQMKVKETTNLLRIGHLLNRRPVQLSGGERQRVALGRAIVREPQVFLMDEPLSNLDAKLRVYMRAELKRLQKELGTTMIFVTHDQAEAMSMADRIAIMNRGEIQQLDSPDSIYRVPINVFVGGFIGSPPMNFLDASFLDMDGSFLLDTGVFNLPLPKEMGEVIKERATGSEVVLGVRPEDVSVHKKHALPTTFESSVYVLEPIGSETIVNLRVGTSIIKAKVLPDLILKMGETVWLEMPQNKLHIFDKKSGKVLV